MAASRHGKRWRKYLGLKFAVQHVQLVGTDGHGHTELGNLQDHSRHSTAGGVEEKGGEGLLPSS